METTHLNPSYEIRRTTTKIKHRYPATFYTAGNRYWIWQPDVWLGKGRYSVKYVAFLSTELRNFIVKENDNNQTQLTVLESVKQHFLPKIFCLFHKSRRISSLRSHRIQYQDFRLADTVSGKHSLIE